MGDQELKKAVGKLLIGKVSGTELDDETADALRTGTISGVTLFSENASSVGQLMTLCAEIHRSYDGQALIAIDQEGGAVQRFDHVITPLPSAMAIAACADLARAREVFEVSCRQLNLLGVNCLLAPVLDVSSNPRNPIVGTRSFGSEPSAVTSLGLTVATTAARFGVMAVGKHFPGHGATHEDSHTALAVNRCDASTLWQRELLPFRGCSVHLPAMMAGHIWLPAVDHESVPATMSAKVVTGLLREYLQFDGLIMTDDLFMRAVADKWGLAEAAVRAVAAGCEQLLVLGGVKEIRSVLNAIVSAVKKGRIAEWQIEQAGARIDESRRELPASPLKGAQPKDLEARARELSDSLPDARQVCLDAASSAICMLRGDKPQLAGEWVILAPEHPRYSFDLAGYLSKALKKKKGARKRIVSKRYALNPSDKDCAEIAESLRGRQCIFLTYRTLSNTGQIRLGKALSETNEQRVTVACDVPYDLIGLPGWSNCMATFDPSDLAMEALSIKLASDDELTGSCPVSLETEII